MWPLCEVVVPPNLDVGPILDKKYGPVPSVESPLCFKSPTNPALRIRVCKRGITPGRSAIVPWKPSSNGEAQPGLHVYRVTVTTLPAPLVVFLKSFAMDGIPTVLSKDKFGIRVEFEQVYISSTTNFELGVLLAAAVFVDRTLLDGMKLRIWFGSVCASPAFAARWMLAHRTSEALCVRA